MSPERSQLGETSICAGTAVGQRRAYWILGTLLAVGLAAYVRGFLLKSSATTERLELVADLLYTFGWDCGPASSWSCSSSHPRGQAPPVQTGARHL